MRLETFKERSKFFGICSVIIFIVGVFFGRNMHILDNIALNFVISAIFFGVFMYFTDPNVERRDKERLERQRKKDDLYERERIKAKAWHDVRQENQQYEDDDRPIKSIIPGYEWFGKRK